MLTSIFELSFLEKLKSSLLSKEKAHVMGIILMNDIKRKMNTEDFKRNKKTIEEKISELIGGLN